MAKSVFEDIPKYPEDEQIAEDLSGIHSEDSLFSSQVKKIIGVDNNKTETTSSDFDKIKQLVLTNQNLKEFLSDAEDKFKTNIDVRESEMKLLASDLKQLSEKVKF